MAKAAPSSRHWKVERLSEEEKAKLALRTLTVPVGPEDMAVSGGVVSVVTFT